MYRICGRHPYVAHDERRLLETIRTHKLRYDSEKFKNLSSEGLCFVIVYMNEKFIKIHISIIGLDFLQGMLVYDTVHRRTMGELTVHPWLTVNFA